MLGTLAELAARVGGTVRGDGSLPIARICAIDEAGPDSLTFATTPSYLHAAIASRAGAILADDALLVLEAPIQKPVIAVPKARVALMQLLRGFDRPRKSGGFRHPTSIVDPTAAVADDTYVGPNVVIGARTVIGAGCTIEAGAYVGDDVRIGSGVRVYPQARIMDACEIGDRVILHPGATVGSEGFGYVFVEDHFERIPQIGNVVLGNDVEIGANTCIDRAQTGSTHIGAGTKIDNLCQIGHNCRIGRNTGMAAQVGLAGSTNVGDYVLVGGQAGFAGHLTIGSRAKIGAGSAVWGDVPEGAFVSGRPARPHKEELRREVMVRGLPKLLARVDALEKQNRQP